jgi:hypothetical protein
MSDKMISGELLEKYFTGRLKGFGYYDVQARAEIELALQEVHSGRLSPPAPAPDGVHTETNCPTCGSAVKVGGDGETHYYIPITAPREVVEGLRKRYEDQRQECLRYGGLYPEDKSACHQAIRRARNLDTVAVHLAALCDDMMLALSRQPSGPGWVSALKGLSLDMHTASMRPCPTCREMTELLGFPFGCYEYQAKRTPQPPQEVNNG